MISNIINWFITTSSIEILGTFVVAFFAIGSVYVTYEIIKQLANLYIQMKLMELYKQKDRLWDAYNDLYDNHEDLKEHTWDYHITKENLKILSKDVADLEEFVLADKLDKHKKGN